MRKEIKQKNQNQTKVLIKKSLNKGKLMTSDLDKFLEKYDTIRNRFIILGCLLLILCYVWNYDTITIWENQNNPQYCGRFEELYKGNFDTSFQCIRECWDNYGCQHNATGYLYIGTCECTGGPIRQKTRMNFQNDMLHYLNTTSPDEIMRSLNGTR
jgi:hypothetical protein